MTMAVVVSKIGLLAEGNIAQTAALLSALAAVIIALSGYAGIRFNRWKQAQDHGIQAEQLAEQRVENTRSYTLDQIDKGLPGVGRVIEILTDQVDRQEAQIAKQELRIELQGQKIDAHEARIEELEAENQRLRLHLDAVRAKLPGDPV